MNNDDIIVYLDIDEEDMYSGMDAMSFVKTPATQIGWNTFSGKDDIKMKTNVKHNFTSDKAKRVVTGPIMLCETPIKRSSEALGIYYVKFSEKTIFSMMTKYFKENKIHTVNENHDGTRKVSNVYLIESFIISDRVTSELYPDLPMGTWMGSYFIEDEDYWNDVILTDEFEGFSLEGHFIENYEMSMIESKFNSIETIMNSNLGDKTKTRKIKNILFK